jgi:hypothetical protein
VEDVEKYVHKTLEEKQPQRIKVVGLGLSRGGMACLMLAKQLQKGLKNAAPVELHLCLYDPVPGNSLTSAKIDFLNKTLANQNMDVSECTILKVKKKKRQKRNLKLIFQSSRFWGCIRVKHWMRRRCMRR